MAKARTTMRSALHYQPQHALVFAENAALFNRVVAFYFDCIQAHEGILSLTNKEALTALERLTHATEHNPASCLSARSRQLSRPCSAVPLSMRLSAWPAPSSHRSKGGTRGKSGTKPDPPLLPKRRNHSGSVRRSRRVLGTRQLPSLLDNGGIGASTVSRSTSGPDRAGVGSRFAPWLAICPKGLRWAVPNGSGMARSGGCIPLSKRPSPRQRKEQSKSSPGDEDLRSGLE